MSDTVFNSHEFQRYARHIQLPSVGAAGQVALKRARVLMIGCGGLGAPVSMYLAAAGVGSITVLDGDRVELSNLQRQISFTEADIGKPKAAQTANRLALLNSDISVTAVDQPLAPDNAIGLVDGQDIVIDCTDNFATRYLINDVCKKLAVPWVYASIHQFSGQLASFAPDGACFRCLFPEAPGTLPDCNAAGVLGVLPGILGTLQAAEVLKQLLGLPGTLSNQLLMVEVSDLLFHKITLQQSPDCATCNGTQAWNAQDSFYQRQCEVANETVPEIDASEFNARSQQESCLIVDVRDDDERAAFHIGGEHVPMEQLPAWLDGQQGGSELLFYCQSGVRSAEACAMAHSRSLQALSLAGGLRDYLPKQIS